MNLLEILHPPRHLLEIPTQLAVKHGSGWPEKDDKKPEPLDGKLKHYMEGKGWFRVSELGILVESCNESTRRALERLKRKGFVASKGSSSCILYKWDGDQS